MISGKKRTEKEYRAIQTDSSSSLKDFSVDRKKYFSKYISGEKASEEDNKATLTGKVVETLLLEPEEFDNRFQMSTTSAPTANMLLFTEALFKYSKECSDPDGNLTKEFKDIAEDAYKESGYKWTLDKVLDKFIGSNAEIYYKEMLESWRRNLSVVTSDDVQNAERIVEELKTNQFTSQIVNLTSSDRFEVINQLQIEGYEIDGLELKSMVDKVIVDHKNETIDTYDLKCVWSVENFYENYYLYRRAYIQAYLYYDAIKYWANEMGYNNYTINYLRFIVCDSINYYYPLIYKVLLPDMENAYNGFQYKGQNYPGVKQIIQDLLFAKENDIWRISRLNYLNSGFVTLK